MSENQKMTILSSDLLRRLSVIYLEKEERRIMRKLRWWSINFIMQIKTSGNGRRRTRDILISGVLGWNRKKKRREECAQERN